MPLDSGLRRSTFSCLPRSVHPFGLLLFAMAIAGFILDRMYDHRPEKWRSFHMRLFLVYSVATFYFHISFLSLSSQLARSSLQSIFELGPLEPNCLHGCLQ